LQRLRQPILVGDRSREAVDALDEGVAIAARRKRLAIAGSIAANLRRFSRRGGRRPSAALQRRSERFAHRA
jgi:hypothetical protein